MKPLDPRLNAIRADLADIAFMGEVEADRFAVGVPMRAGEPSTKRCASTSPRSLASARSERNAWRRVSRTVKG